MPELSLASTHDTFMRDSKPPYSSETDISNTPDAENEVKTRHHVLVRAVVETRSGVLVAIKRGSHPIVKLETMPLYVRAGIRMLFGDRSRISGAMLNSKWVEHIFRRQSILEGRRFDDPRHAQRRILHFIQTYNIDCSELLTPDIRSYSTLNEFFYRRLNPGARPIADPFDRSIISSAADCRLCVFSSVSLAQKIWIKGRNFSLAKLLGSERSAQYFSGGSIACFRLAPADYHRYHAPFDALVGRTRKFDGQYLTVQPIVVQNPSLDVFVTYLEPTFTPSDAVQGPVAAFVQIGALLVGSVNQSVQRGQRVERGEELGYFAYGGSTIVAVFPPGTVTFDQDLLRNSAQPLETIVKVGERIGSWNR